ncbi:MAG: RnfABCDGE type electron transport complex subunit C, partial [Treponema sp.]|nr:RnfABCDGE type electron transport complex subunit C [Treponema sp.]
MRRYSFRGGVHPAEYKELSRDIAITEAKPSSGTVAIPVTMGGAPNTPTVKPGDHVTKGQVIADSTAFMSAPVHASLSGTVKEIVSCLGPSNKQEQCIVIESDGTDSTAYMPPLDPFSCDRKDAVQRIRDAGIVGMGGASFPTHVKFSPAPGTTIEYVLLNAAECEPYLTVDYRTMKESPEKVIDGFSIAVHLSGGTGIIALEENKADLVDVLNDAIGKAGKSDTIAVRVMKTKYPQGSEKTITLALLGREVPSGGLPANIGCLIINVNTACAISDAFREGKPLIERSFTVSGGGCAAPKNLRVPVGTKVSDLGDLVAMKHPDTKKIIAGGPMM